MSDDFRGAKSELNHHCFKMSLTLVSQTRYSLVTRLGYGGILNDRFIADFMVIVIVKEFRKSACSI